MDRFFIGPLRGTLQTDVKPWALPDQSFANLVNAYHFRDRIRKRFGSRYMVPSDGAVPGYEQLTSRLAIEVDTIVGGTASGTVPGAAIAGTTFVGQMFSVGTNLYTANLVNGALLVTNPLTNGTYDTTTGNYTINDPSPDGTAVIWYPSLPVMGLPTYQTGPINDLPTLGFDTRFAYQYTNAGWRRIGSSTTAPNPGIWSGSNSQFFWAENYQASSTASTLLFVTNNNPADLMQYWDGANWNTFNPQINAAGYKVTTCLIIVAFKSRLVLANTTELEGITQFNYKNGIRWSQVGDASNASPFAWYDDQNAANYKGAGFLRNSQTQEAIVGCEFIKDRCIFSYERSTYELAYTGNQQQPFIWNLLNTELGAESTFSSIPFDQFIMTVGNVGIHQCNGSNVSRVDELIPDEVFDIRNENNGVQRVYGIRDYYSEMAYWTYADDDQTNPNADTYPNRVFVYNYRLGAWSFNTDSITCFGYFNQVSDQTWQTTLYTWAELNQAWNAGAMQGQFRQVIGGNQEGYTFIIDRDTSRNVGGLQITDMSFAGNNVTLTINDHNLSTFENSELSSEYVLIENAQDSAPGNITNLNGKIYQIVSVGGVNTITIDAREVISGTYSGGGTVARVSNINILTKDFNPYRKDGKNVYIQKIDFLIDRTDPNPATGFGGAVTVDYYPSSSYLSTLTTAEAGVLYGTTPSVLETTPYPAIYYPLEQYQEEIWHPLYFQADGTSMQFRIYMSYEQMIRPETSLQDFQLHAMILNCSPVGRLQ